MPIRTVDDVRNAGFPTVQQLRRGVLLRCISTSFWLAARPTDTYVFWEGDTYFEDQHQGEQWAATFSNCGAVVVFFSSESPRNPFPKGRPPYDAAPFFRGMPSSLNSTKDRAMTVMKNMGLEIGNSTDAGITAAMWSDGKRFTAAESWADVYQHSLWECYQHLLPPSESLRQWWKEMELPASARRAAWSIYQRRLRSTERWITIEKWEWQEYIRVAGQIPKPSNLLCATNLLADVGVRFKPQ